MFELAPLNDILIYAQLPLNTHGVLLSFFHPLYFINDLLASYSKTVDFGCVEDDI